MSSKRFCPRIQQSGFYLLLSVLLPAFLYVPGTLAEVSSGLTSSTAKMNSDNLISSPVASANLGSNLTTAEKPTRDYFILQPYKPLYAMVAYDRTLGRGDAPVQPWEMQFQISFKIQIMTIPWTSGKLAFGYTQVSFWQVFNGNRSSPFRETNYAPEFMASFDYDTTILGLHKIRTKYAAIHQSNGLGGQESRSWNRVYGEINLDWDHVTIGLKPWYRIPERQKSSSSDARGDDNPDLTRYMGYGELTAEYRADWWSLLLTARNNLRAGPNYGSIQVDLAIPIKNDAKFFIQFFDGYGLSLIDYNRHSRRVGFGILIEKLPRLW